MEQDNLNIGDYAEVSRLSDYLQLDSRRYDGTFGGEG